MQRASNLTIAGPAQAGWPAPSVPASAPGGGVAWASMAGRLTQVASAPGGGATSVAVAYVQQAQRQGEPVAWVQWERGNLYPPDLAAAGVRLDALLVVHAGHAGQTQPRLRAAELLLRSGGFGLVVLDLTAGVVPPGLAWQHRLQTWARQHHGVVLLLTHQADTQAASLGALIALQIVPQVAPVAAGRFALTCAVHKNKLGQNVPDWSWARRGPQGLGG